MRSAGGIGVGLALVAGSGPSKVTAVQWILCTSSQILLALLDWGVRKRLPGIISLCRRFSHRELAGPLLPHAAGLPFFTEAGAHANS
jgi:hypothetical protein